MSGIAQDIDRIILHQLKLHQTTTEDLVNHIADKLVSKYPDADFNVDGIGCRLDALKAEGKVKSKLIEKQKPFQDRIVWSLCQPDTIPNKVWHILTHLASLEYHRQKIIFTITRQHPSITPNEIELAISQLEVKGITYTEKNIVKVSPSEKQFLIQEIRS
mgnify:CR=1 FL=1|jgi:hypothetical protein